MNESDYEIKRINPLLNTVVELSDEYSEKQRIIYSDPEKEIFPSENEVDRRKEYNMKYFKMGHFEQNLSHNSYLTNMRKLFAEKEGKLFVTKIKKKLDEEYVNSFLSIKADDSAKLFSIKSIAEKLEYTNFSKNLLKELNTLIDKSLEIDLKKNEKKLEYIPEFIFYPIFSGIENYHPKEFNETFKTPIENIIGMQRFNTGKGWRFPFPAKRFNNITKGKKVLIFDSGSLTGESLIQMVDSISFLEVDRIDVISVIGRIEDYNREFFSRIKTNKVKPLKDEERYRDRKDLTLIQINELEKNRLAFANINILFGINLHIPVYPSKSVCPYCLEISSLELYDDMIKEQSNFPKGAKKYIENRKIEISITSLNEYESSSAPSYIPCILTKEDTNEKYNEYDLIRIFSMRDKLGKIDSYRFYKQYFDPFDNDIIKQFTNNFYFDKEQLRKIELILICILHEPKLFEVHKDLLVKIYDRCKNIITDIISNPTLMEELNYNWSKYSILRLYYLYLKERFFDVSTLEVALKFCDKDTESLNYISFLILENCNSKNLNTKISTEKSLLAISRKFETETEYFNNNSSIREIIKQLNSYLNPTEVKTILDAFKNLRLFFDRNHPIYNHNIIEDKISYLSICVANNAINALEEMILYSDFIVEKISIGLKEPLNKLHKNEVFSKIPEVEAKMLFQGNNSFFKKFDEIYILNESLKNIKSEDYKFEIFNILKNLSNALDDLQFDFLKKDKPFNDYCKAKFPCDLSKEICNLVCKYANEDENRFKLIIHNNIPENTFLDIHQLYLNYCLENIASNVKKHYPACITELTFSLEKEDGFKIIHIHQNKPIKPPKELHEGGIDKYVIPIFESFLTPNCVYVENDLKKDFCIKIKLEKI